MNYVIVILTFLSVEIFIIYSFLFTSKVKSNTNISSQLSNIKNTTILFNETSTKNVFYENNSLIKESNIAFWEQYDPWNISKQYIIKQASKMPKNIASEVKNNLDNMLPEYSGYSIHRHNYFELYYMYLRNVCYNMNENTIYYYYPKDNNTYRTLPFNKSFNLFKWTVKFKHMNQPFPTKSNYIYMNDGVWLLIKPWPNHVGHFFETISYPFDIIQDTDFFLGPMKEVLFVNQGKEIEYNSITYQLFKDLLKIANIDIYNQEEIISQIKKNNFNPPIFCLRTVGLMERNTKIEMGGFFLSKIGSDIYRSFIYKYIGVQYSRENKSKYNMYLVGRRRTRKWKNYNEIRNTILNTFNSSLVLYEIAFEDYSFKQQAKFMFDSDITMLSHGSGETNLIYMKPYSVVIEGNPKYMFERFGSTISITSRLHFIHLNNQDNDIIYFNKVCNKLDINGCINWCKKEVIQHDLTIPLPYIYSSLLEAISFLNGINFNNYRPKIDELL